MKLVTTILLALCVGCASRPVNVSTATAAGLGGVQSDAVALGNIFDSLATSPLVKHGRQLVADLKQRAIEAQKANDAAVDNASKLSTKLAASTQALTDEKGHWVGYQARLAGKWIISIALALWVGLGAVGAYLPAGGIGSTILRLLPFANPWATIRDRVIKP